VHNVEEDGSGFFITGINTHGPENDVHREEIEAIEEEADPADKYKHVAVVDCSKAFSNQEVSSIAESLLLILYLFFSVRLDIRQTPKHYVFKFSESNSVQI
jgi:hypothetical protein